MNKAKAILKDLRNLDLYIASLIRRREKIEASLLSSPKWTADKVSGGAKKKQDDVYVELMATADDIEKKTAEAIKKQRELQNIIDNLNDDTSKTILSLVYIDKISMYDVMDEMRISDRTYYRLLRIARKELEASLAVNGSFWQ
ncbi:DUF1492 domain-containing protein [Streptococcus suis]|uniref:DUF1492 domain-containing protein n=2 Tax=Streptococcus suis TaxID=1307 RepID=UPI000CF3935A|nr:DUF1492 domain-containing protein [Streptococcus suis]MBY5026852.1 DUF1492 domain-containing protein [Streptococcus suis]QZT17902.1 DUF1492 domain-containing protein [Streptococcus suis]